MGHTRLRNDLSLFYLSIYPKEIRVIAIQGCESGEEYFNIEDNPTFLSMGRQDSVERNRLKVPEKEKKWKI